MDKVFDVHVFVCTNDKVGGCAEKGGLELWTRLRAEMKLRSHWQGRVRINKAGCLSFCEQGPTVVAYPQTQWSLNASFEKLIEQIEMKLKSDMP